MTSRSMEYTATHGAELKKKFINDLGQLVWGLDCVIGNTYNEFRNHDLTHSQGLPGGKEEKYRKELVSSEMKIANLGFAKLANTVHQSSDAEYHKVLQDTASQVWAQRGHHGLPANAASKALEEVQRYAHAFNLTEGELLEYRSHVEKLAQGNDEQLVRKLVGTTLVARINTQLKRMAPISGECTESEIKNLIDKIAKSPWPKDAAQALREFEKLYLPILYRHFLVQVKQSLKAKGSMTETVIDAHLQKKWTEQNKLGPDVPANLEHLHRVAGQILSDLVTKYGHGV